MEQNGTRGEKVYKELVLKLAELYNVDSDRLVIDFLSEKVLSELADEDLGFEALKVAEKQLRYKRNKLRWIFVTHNVKRQNYQNDLL